MEKERYDRKTFFEDAPIVKSETTVTSETLEKAKLNVDANELISFEIESEYTKLLNEDQNKVIPVMFSIKAKDVNIELPRVGIDLILVIDVSSSMMGEKLKLVIDTVNFIIEELRPEDRFAVVKFNHSSKIISGLIPMTQENKNSLRKKILTDVQASGSTNIALGLTDAFDIMLNRKFVNSLTSVCLLSDGADTCGNSHPTFARIISTYDKMLKEKEMDYKINSFGYGIDHDEELLSNIANQRYGNFYYINNLKKVDECFIDLVGFLLSVFALKGKVQVFLSQDCTMKQTYGNNWNKEKEEGKYSFDVGAIGFGMERNYVCEIEVKKVDPEMTRLLVGCLSFEVNGENITRFLEFKALTSASERGDFNQKVADNVVRVRSAAAIKTLETNMKLGKKEEAWTDFNNFIHQNVTINKQISEECRDKIGAFANNKILKDVKIQKVVEVCLEREAYAPEYANFSKQNRIQKQMLLKRR